MGGADGTLTGGFFHAFSFLGALLFTWIPATVISLTSTIGSDATTSPVRAVSEPIAASQFPGFVSEVTPPDTYNALVHAWTVFAIGAFLLATPFVLVAAYTGLRLWQLRRREWAAFDDAQQPVAAKDVPRVHLRWNRVLEQANADTPESWRLAILEADIMLNELLDTLGYRGETMADKMREVDRARFNTIDQAWEAHKVRNEIAHRGSEHELNQREVRRVIGLYEHVFREFQFIE